MVTKVYRWGIAGCGNIADFHAKAINELADARLVACVDASSSKTQEFARIYGIESYTDIREMLREGLDILSVCTPNASHKEIALEAFKHGVHVIAEKPIATTLAAIDEMISTADKRGVQLGCIFQTRFGEAEKRLKRLVEEGAFGQVVLCEADVRWYRPQEYYDSGNWRGTWTYEGGGALMTQAIHTIDLLQWYMGPVLRIYGQAKTMTRRIQTEDTAVAILEFKNGALGVIKGATSTAPGFPRKLGIYGSEASAELIAEKLIIYGFENPSGTTLVEEEGDASVNPLAISHDGHKRQLADFLAAVREGRTPLVDAREARKVVEIILAIYRASLKGTIVRLNPNKGG